MAVFMAKMSSVMKSLQCSLSSRNKKVTWRQIWRTWCIWL